MSEIIAHNNDSVFRYSFLFDDFKNKVVENKYYVSEKNLAYPLLRTEWVYDKNQCILQREQKWLNGAWETFYLTESVYVDDLLMDVCYTAVSNNTTKIEKTVVHQYAGNKLQSVESYQGNKALQQLVKSESYVYDASNRLNNMQIDASLPLGISFKQIFNYTYNAAGSLDSLMYSDFQDGMLVNKQLTIFFYDNAGRFVGQTQKGFDLLTSKWKSQTKSTYCYDLDGQIIQEIYSHYNGAYWLPDVKYDYSYDRKAKLQSKIMSRLLYRQWRNIYTIEYSSIESTQPNLIESKYNFWGGITGDYVKSYIPYYFNNEIAIMEANRMEIKYTPDPSLVRNPSAANNWLKIYPNPSNGVFYINTQQHFIESWEVFDLHGNCVKAATNNFNTGIVDLSGCADGMYMIKALTNDEQQFKQKIIIQRNQ